MNNRNNSAFANIFQSDRIICNLKSQAREDAYRELLEILLEDLTGQDSEALWQALNAREAISSSVAYPGVAVPHLRINGIKNPLLAIGTSVAGVQFERDEEPSIHMIFLVLTPAHIPDAYLQFLAGLSKKIIAFKEIRLLAGCTSPDELCSMLTAGPYVFPPFLSAMHVMDPRPVTLLESDFLGTAIQVFCEKKVSDIPVVDEQGDLRGVISLEDLLRMSLPEHLLWMNDLTPIIQFEPFADLLLKQRDVRLADCMREKYVSVEPTVPAVQLAKTFIIERTRHILVLDKRRLLGTVELHSFISKLFWA